MRRLAGWLDDDQMIPTTGSIRLYDDDDGPRIAVVLDTGSIAGASDATVAALYNGEWQIVTHVPLDRLGIELPPDVPPF